MVVFESGPPIGSSEQSLKRAGQVDKAVAHEEEHGEQRRDFVHVADEHGDLADGDGQAQGADRFAGSRLNAERSQERDNSVHRYGLEQSGSTGKGL